MQIDQLIISSVLRDGVFLTKVFPYLKTEYFQDSDDKKVFDLISNHIQKFTVAPDKTQLLLEAQEFKWTDWDEVKNKISSLWEVEIPDDKGWLIQKAEEFCQHQAVYNAIMQSIAIYDGSNKELSTQAIPDIVRDAVSISFDTDIGMDLVDDALARYDFYTSTESKVSFKIGLLNEVTNNGLPNKTLTLIIAPTNAGKSMVMISLAADFIRYGYDVLYITMEMREEAILQRIEANLFDTSINDIPTIDRENYIKKIDKLKKKSFGKLKVKEYPPVSAHSRHFKHLLNELKNKKGFKPRILFIDYLGIIASSRMKYGSQSSYFYLKAAAEELRALAVEEDIVIISAMQINRQGMTSSDFELSDVSESMGVAHTADAMFGVIRTDELDQSGHILFKQLKNRFGNKTDRSKFILGVDLSKQKIFDVGGSVQEEIILPEKAMKLVGTGETIKDKFKALNS